MDNDNLMALKYPIRVGVRKGRKPTQRKPLKHRRDQLQELSHMKCLTTGMISVVRGITCKPLTRPVPSKILLSDINNVGGKILFNHIVLQAQMFAM